ncbi:TPA: hypothetical protein HA273_03325 [Candidatus Bathyarchaeota archaeon]|nr:hypothetical protein [Candidatus Bathyarchaeota archaeon]HIJ08398.1 hypothetical protein [Candidatus Bathyarchaeota archaeon]
MDEVKVLVEVEINPTESSEKVKSAVENIFGNLQMTINPSHLGSVLEANGEGRQALEAFRNLLRRDRVRAAARKLLSSELRGNTVTFFLNKQAAFANHVSFSQEVRESPLGPIKVTIDCQNPRELIDWLAPRTQ